MIKKLLLLAAVGGLAFVGIRATKMGSYARTEVSALGEWADEQIPVEKKIATMRKEVSGLDRDIEAVKDELAKEIVEVRELNTNTAQFRAQIENEQKSILARGEQLKDATEKVTVGKLTISVPEAKDQLQRDVSRHVNRKKQLASMEQSLGHRERIKDSLEKQLDGMVKQKQELAAAIDAVEAEYKSLQLQQIESKYQTDDSRLAKIKESLRGMRKKLDVEREKLKLTPRTSEEAVDSAKSVDEILAPLSK